MWHIMLIKWLTKCKNEGIFNQFFMAVMVTIPALNFGMVMGWQSPMMPILKDPDGPASYSVSDETFSWMASVAFLPPIFCGFLVGRLADKFGRKAGTMMTSLSLTLSWAITMFSLQPWALITSRVIAGLACAGCYIVTPLYLKEISSDNVRGALGSLFILFQNMGYLVIYVAGDILSFGTVMWLCLAIPAMHLVVFVFMPETPVFLLKQNKTKEARKVLAWLRGSNPDDKTLDEVLSQIEAEEQECSSQNGASWRSIAANVMISQETCGYLVVLTYASSIFEKAAESISLKLSPNKQTIVVGVIQLLGSILASCIVEQTGRKKLLAWTSFVTGLAMLSLGGWFLLSDYGISLPGWLPVLAMSICIFADAAGYQPVPYVIMSELFSFEHRGIVTSIISSLCALSDFLQTKAYQPLQLLGIHWVLIFFSIICFLGTLYTVLWVPETKNKSLQEIYNALKDDRKKEKRKEPDIEVCRL